MHDDNFEIIVCLFFCPGTVFYFNQDKKMITIKTEYISPFSCFRTKLISVLLQCPQAVNFRLTHITAHAYTLIYTLLLIIIILLCDFVIKV